MSSLDPDPKAASQAMERIPREATKQEIKDLVHDVGKVPLTVWLLTFTGAAAQLARYGVTVAWQNYLQNPRYEEFLPGALGLGQAKATTIQNAFLFFQFIAPIPFALLSDAVLGRYKTMLICYGLAVLGYVVLLLTSVPAALDHGAGIPGIAIAMILCGLGQGGLSAVMYPFIADQIPDEKPQVMRNRKGGLSVTDRKLTIQYVFSGYYWMVNIAALSIIPTTLLEKNVDFWAAYLLPTMIFIVAVVPVVMLNHRLIKLPPQGNVLPQASQVMWIACRSGFSLTAALPDNRRRNQQKAPWNEDFVMEIKRALKGCRVILCFVIFWLCYNQTTNNIISQAGQMRRFGVSNDTIQALNPIACIVLTPFIQGLVFPLLRRLKIPHGPMLRITIAFIFISAGIAYAAGLQRLIYSRGPCFEYPLECATAEQDGQTNAARPNDVNVWLQTPLHFILAVGEILGLVALNEYTYTEAPTNLKSMVQAFQELAAALGAALGIALGPVSRNPHLVVLYASLAAAMALCGALFWIFFRHSDVIYANRDVDAAEETVPE